MSWPDRQGLFALLVAIVAMGLVVEMLRRRRLREKYAVIWVLIGLAALVFALWPNLLTTLSQTAGFDTPSNLLFVLSLGVSFFVALQLSSEVGTLEEESRTLAEEVGLLRMQVAELGRRLEVSTTAEGTPTPLSPSEQAGDVARAAEDEGPAQES